jgi:hypothetical protein
MARGFFNAACACRSHAAVSPRYSVAGRRIDQPRAARACVRT